MLCPGSSFWKLLRPRELNSFTGTPVGVLPFPCAARLPGTPAWESDHNRMHRGDPGGNGLAIPTWEGPLPPSPSPWLLGACGMPRGAVRSCYCLGDGAQSFWLWSVPSLAAVCPCRMSPSTILEWPRPLVTNSAIADHTLPSAPGPIPGVCTVGRRPRSFQGPMACVGQG